MTANIAFWTSVLHEAERELEAATSRVALDRAASKLMAAKVKLKRLRKASGSGKAAGRPQASASASANEQ